MTDAPKRKAKTIEQKIADIRRKEAWRLTRKAEKIEAQAAALRNAAAALEAEAAS